MPTQEKQPESCPFCGRGDTGYHNEEFSFCSNPDCVGSGYEIPIQYWNRISNLVADLRRHDARTLFRCLYCKGEHLILKTKKGYWYWRCSDPKCGYSSPGGSTPIEALQTWHGIGKPL